MKFFTTVVLAAAAVNAVALPEANREYYPGASEPDLLLSPLHPCPPLL
jgi:hypothetical protein